MKKMIPRKSYGLETTNQLEYVVNSASQEPRQSQDAAFFDLIDDTDMQKAFPTKSYGLETTNQLEYVVNSASQEPRQSQDAAFFDLIDNTDMQKMMPRHSYGLETMRQLEFVMNSYASHTLNKVDRKRLFEVMPKFAETSEKLYARAQAYTQREMDTRLEFEVIKKRMQLMSPELVSDADVQKLLRKCGRSCEEGLTEWEVNRVVPLWFSKRRARLAKENMCHVR